MQNYLIFNDDLFDPFNGLDNLKNRQGVYMLLSKESHVLYVGRSKDLCKRIKTHYKDAGKPFQHVSVFIIDDVLATEETEAFLINIHKPTLNNQNPLIRKTNEEIFMLLRMFRTEFSELRYDIRNNKIES